MEFAWAGEDVAFREQVRDFLAREAPPLSVLEAEELGSKARADRSREFAAKLAERGWLTPHWPRAYGGQDASAWQHIILAEEMVVAGEPRGPQYMNVNWVGPSIILYGTEEQKRHHLPRISGGDVIWCQGFSEPEAGSDLASLRTRAERDGDDYVVNGEKIWTSYANSADFCYLLVRTDASGSKHHGITILLVPMSTPGLEVNDVGSITGDHSFHHLVFTDMRVPAAARLGPENQGWSIIRRTLEFERMGVPRYAKAMGCLERLTAWAVETGRWEDSIAEELGQARAEIEAARVLAYRVIDEREKGATGTPSPYVVRAAMVRAERLVAELAMRLQGLEALEDGSLADAQFRWALASGIAGGTYEVQLELVSKLCLGLPRH